MSTSLSTPDVENIIEIDVSDEMRGSFLEYAYSVIYARALPDARDGCKPVQRRILYQMSQMGLRPEKGHVKSQGVVGEVMAKLHPHGDTAIYDALVRLAQPFNLRLPLIDGHGNFGSLDDGPAAARYTEARLAPAAMDLVANLDENVVDFVPNYDNRNLQPDVLPAGFPQLLVNGAMGIAVGMATNIAPHNLGEVVAATCHLIDNPQATTEDLMRFIPGPDLPEGGIIVGLEGIKQAYETGRGSFKTRAKIVVERISARKQGLVITELPYLVGPERVIEKIKEAVNSKKLQGISNVSNLTDRHHGVRLVVEVKNGFNPQAVMAQLYKFTPLEDNFSINAVALVEGRPMTMGLKQMLEVYVSHRLEVVSRRTKFRLQKALDRLHLVQGLLIAILDIDDVIAIIRSSEDVDSARQRLMDVFDLSDIQADHILSLRLRRLTKFSRIELEAEQAELLEQVKSLQEILDSEQVLRAVVRDELVEVAKRHSTARRTVLLSVDPQQVETAGKVTAVPLEIPDAPVQVVLTTNGGLLRVDGAEPLEKTDTRGIWDTYRVAISTTARSQVGLVDSTGTLHRVEVVDLPEVPRSASNPSFAGAISASQLLGQELNPVGLLNVDKDEVAGFVTAQGQIKRMRPDYAKADSFETILLAAGDEVLFAAPCSDEAEIVLVTSDAQLLRTPAAKIRPQGRVAGGVVGMVIGEGARLLEANFVPAPTEENPLPAQVVTVAATADGLLGSMQSSVKVSDLEIYPVKGRATQGVRCHRFLKSESELVLARVTVGPAIATSTTGEPLALPEVDPRRDGSGQAVAHEIAGLV
ncbi:DNA topoisomerase IV subunit A [Gleimia sp. 6138-11-ORH1]|uniref:DNA gyrase/topoisomerase IV subunit A n=1 Tax=Gleimia sp. 6138-11-ORH1 TaxID=2973937 RepID=UPI002169C7B0|nr:DNA topoisomerase IV subunit A [Gleimia sp. 6138-11-ORH1]MCS4484437.1 DNA topoisomerase IV subunit A [Gleimia sp. 6138-11-ORH1]